MERRTFLEKAMAAAAIPSSIYSTTVLAEGSADDSWKSQRPVETKRGEMRYRQLGRTGEDVSIIGLGGHQRTVTNHIEHAFGRRAITLDRCGTRIIELSSDIFPIHVVWRMLSLT